VSEVEAITTGNGESMGPRVGESRGFLLLPQLRRAKRMIVR
jgi:hypothetical protein